MTRAKQRTYGAIVACGLCAFVADRTIRLNGSPAIAAAAGDKPDATVSRTDAAESVTNIPPLAATRFPADLPKPDQRRDGRDPFALTEQALFVLAPPAEVPVAVQQESAPASAPPSDLFQQDHTLSAVLRNGATWIAIVDGVAVLPGQVIDGCVLREVRERSVSFTCPDGEASLTLNDFAIPDD